MVTEISLENSDWNLGSTTFIQTLYYMIFIRALLTAIFLPSKHYISRNGVVLCLFYRLIPAIIMQLVTGKSSIQVNPLSVVCDGVFMSIITSDLILSKMAKRGKINKERMGIEIFL
jgi:hypothetical protein